MDNGRDRICDIIIPVWNQLEATKGCISSIQKYTGSIYRLIIIDNASSDETRKYLELLRDDRGGVVLIRNEQNLGFVKAVNQGIAASSAQYLCIMNNDTLATAGWLNEMMSVMGSHPDIGLLNPSSNTSGQFPDKGQSIDGFGSSLAKFKGEIQELYTCRGFCMLVRRAVIDKLGLLDEIYHLGYFDDTDYCKRAQLAGFKTARAKGSYVYHHENTSFKTLDENSELFKKNEEIFFRRWGRPLRVGYVIDKSSSRERINDIAISVARDGHQISIFHYKGMGWPVDTDHFDVRGVAVFRALFVPHSLYKIIKRRKKKALHIIITDSTFFGWVLQKTRKYHGSSVLVRPDRDRILGALSEMSKLS